MITSEGLRKSAVWVLKIAIALSLIALLDTVLVRLGQAISAPVWGPGCNCRTFRWPEYRLDRTDPRSLIDEHEALPVPQTTKKFRESNGLLPE
jgi:hypothetical protein